MEKIPVHFQNEKKNSRGARPQEFPSKIPRAFWWSKFLVNENNLKFEERDKYELKIIFGPKSRDCDSSILMNLQFL